MTCPHCQSSTTRRRKERTSLGYRTSCCASCRRRFNERTGTPFSELQCPTDVVLLAVLWRLRYKLNYSGSARPCAVRGHRTARRSPRPTRRRSGTRFGGGPPRAGAAAAAACSPGGLLRRPRSRTWRNLGNRLVGSSTFDECTVFIGKRSCAVSVGDESRQLAPHIPFLRQRCR